MTDSLSILWRGPLDSCNYGCRYCPFAKRRISTKNLALDQAQLGQFVQWAIDCRRTLRILFTPWGEALIHPWYQHALITLSHLPHLELVAIQTNGSGPMAWTNDIQRDRCALWITWHPSEISRDTFLKKIRRLHARGVRFSVGCVAVPAHLPEIEWLRSELPDEVHLWVNAHRPHTRYAPPEIQRWAAIDPHFHRDLYPQASFGKACSTGSTALAVEGDGTIRRCHFVPTVLGNLYSDSLDDMLVEHPCPRGRCDCYIGYMHMPHLGMEQRFGASGLARLLRSTTI